MHRAGSMIHHRKHPLACGNRNWSDQDPEQSPGIMRTDRGDPDESGTTDKGSILQISGPEEETDLVYSMNRKGEVFMAYCKSCGAELPEHAKFCLNCGAVISGGPRDGADGTDAENEASGGKEGGMGDPSPMQSGAPGAIREDIGISEDDPRYTGNEAAGNPYGTAPGNGNEAARGQTGGTPDAGKIEKPEEKKRMSPWLGIILLAAAIVGLFLNSWISLVLGGAIFVLAIVCLVKRAKLKGFAIAALVISCFLIVVGSYHTTKGVQKLSIRFGGTRPLSAVGTYIGEDGTGLTLFLDGTGTYYDQGSGSFDQRIVWNYDKNQVRWFYNHINQVIYADVKNGDMKELYFQCKAGPLFWYDENYVKVTDEAEKMSISQYDVLIAKTLYGTEKPGSGSGLGETKPEQRTEEAKPEESSDEDQSSFFTDGVDPDLKAALDSYEAFVDRYVEFMESYDPDSSDALGMLSEYLEMLSEIEEFSEKIDSYDQDEMSAADLAYYLEVTGRCTKKLLSVNYGN